MNLASHSFTKGLKVNKIIHFAICLLYDLLSIKEFGYEISIDY